MSKKTTASAADRKALAFHLAEVMRLARKPGLAATDFYNDLGEVINNHVYNELATDSDSAEIIGFALSRIAARREGAKGKV